VPSLRSIFTLQDNYSRSMDRIWNSTQRATSGISKASSAVDTVSNKFTMAGNATSRLTSRLTGLVAAALSFATLKKGMEISDTYTNINSQLSLITRSAKELNGLQSQIFAAADRARGSYTDMAGAVAKLGITSKAQFGSNQNIVKFTETLQKMFKIGGAGTAEQSAAILQITQAIGSGKLQGDEFRSIMENAPMAAQAIAKYLGKSTGDLKKLSTEGKLTSNVVINGVLSAAAATDKQVGKMSYTWGDYWNKIKNGAYQAFSGVFSSENSALGSKGFQTFIDGIVNSFSALANVANTVMNVIGRIASFFTDNWSTIGPIIFGVIGAIAALTIATWAQAAAQSVVNFVTAASPLTWIILALVAVVVIIYEVVNAINQATGSTISATGIIVGAIFVAASAVWDVAIGLLNGLIQLVWSIFAEPFLGITEWVLNVANGGFNSFGGAVANLIGQIIGWFLSLGQVVTKIIDAIFGTNWTAGLESLKGAVTSWGKNDKAITLTDGKNKPPTIGQRWDPKSAWNSGYKSGQGIDTKVKNWTSGLGKLPPQKAPPYTPIPTYGGGAGKNKPVKVKGTGADGSVKVDIADQDLQYLRDLAEKQYINKFSTAVLSPKLTVNFSGNAGDKENQQQIYSTIGKMLKEELATAAEGYYPV